MANQPDQHQRSVLPIPARAYTGLIKYDAKDPETSFHPSALAPAGRGAQCACRLDPRRGLWLSQRVWRTVFHTRLFKRLAASGLRYNRFHTTGTAYLPAERC